MGQERDTGQEAAQGHDPAPRTYSQAEVDARLAKQSKHYEDALTPLVGELDGLIRDVATLVREGPSS